MLHYMVCPGLPTQEGCSSMGPYQPGTAMPFGVTGQSGQSKLRTAGGHRPGGPTIADPERPACSYNVQPDSEAREAEAELGLGRHIWPALMADIGGTRYVTRGNMPFPQRAPPVRESVRVGGGKCRLPAGNKRGDQRKLIILDERTDSCVSACRCILVAWDGICPWSVIQIRRPDKRETVSLAYHLLSQLSI